MYLKTRKKTKNPKNKAAKMKNQKKNTKKFGYENNKSCSRCDL